MRTDPKDKTQREEKSAHLALSNSKSLTNPPGLATEDIFLSAYQTEKVFNLAHTGHAG